ncbi:MAG: response regulator [Planctomycetota bacterium]|nr:response regulator [Planctomycetota bacterium]
MTHTIVFADNERSIRRFCKHELEAAGYRVLLAEDGVEAVDIVDAFSVDLVILDEHMPRCCGLEAAKRIKQWYPALPVILFTADADYEGFNSPLVDVAINKSEDLSALKASVVKLLFDSSPTNCDSDATQVSESPATEVAC